MAAAIRRRCASGGRCRERGVLDLDALFTHRIGLDGLGQAFAWIRDRPDGFLTAVVTM
jgi:hypothetical protein